VIDISNYAGEDSVRWEPVLTGGPARPTGYAEPEGPRDRNGLGGTPPTGNRAPGAFGAAVHWLACLLRRLGDRRFAVTDAEADWWGWQMTKLQGGLGRRYRDSRFGTPGEGS
jgi:hypothetical protein